MSKKKKPLTKTEIAKQLHVVRTNIGFGGTWGRGFTLQEAMKNANIRFNDKTPFTYFHFADDSWDILDSGTIKWGKDALIHQEEFVNGWKRPKP